LPLGEYYCLLLIESQVDPALWTNALTVERARMAVLAIVCLLISSTKAVPTETGGQRGLDYHNKGT
jgi:hypothetical protein